MPGPLRFGVHLSHYRAFDVPEPAVELAQLAEESGFSSVWVGDHIVQPRDVKTVYPGDPPGTFRTTQAPGGMADPLVLLGVIAGKTTTLRLGLYVLIVPYRPAMLTAKQISTLDALSGGRAIAGAGVGWLEQEFEALGVPFEERGPRTDEAIKVWRELWTGKNVEFHGNYTDFKPLFMLPRPVQPGGPPVWIGGGSAPARRRAALLGDGWLPNTITAARYGSLIGEIREQAAAAGRTATTAAVAKRMKIVDTSQAQGDPADPKLPLFGTPDEIIAEIRAYRDAGVEEFVISQSGNQPEEIEELIKRFSRDIMPAFK
jgi:probable F420-dependent oxidoreductase